jgi:tetratricopeptide (TPR) repeat protein
MGLISAAAFILATQGAPKIVTASEGTATAARLNEIWDHIDNRFIKQSDLWFERGEFPSCVALLKVQSAYTPDDFEIVTNLGWMLENIDRYPESRDIYLDFGNRHPMIGDAMYPLGLSFFSKKEYQNAINVLEPTLAKNVGPNTYRTLARAYEMLKKPNDAIRIWELELKKFPGELSATANIKRVKLKMASGGK